MIDGVDPQHDDEAQSGRLIVLLGALAAIAALSIDFYLPGLPAIGRDLGASSATVALTLTAFLAGVGAGQVIAGSVGDALGRRRPIMAGTAAYIVASVGCAIAPNIGVLITLRAVQGLAAAAGMVLARAVVRDLWAGARAARAFSLLLVIASVAPVLAPLAGGQILRVTSWRGTFVVLAIYGALLLIAVARMPETLGAERRRSGGIRAALRGYAALLRHRRFMCLTIAQATVGGGALFAYIATAPFLFQDSYGLSPQAFSLLFAANSVGIIAAGQLNVRLLRRWSPFHLLMVGLLTAMGAAGILVVSSIGGDPPLAFAALPLAVIVASLGLVVPNGAAVALEDLAHVAGSASAVLGLSQYAFGAAAAPIIGVAGAGSVTALAVTLLLLGAVGVGAALLAART